MSDKPMINIYELDEEGVEQLVYREMTDEEYAQHQADIAALEEQAAAQVNSLVAAVEAMSDEERAQVADLLSASQAAVQARITPPDV